MPRLKQHSAACVVGLICSVQTLCGAYAQETPPSPAASERTIAAGIDSLVIDGWTSTAVAWEPDVVDPVAAVFDEQGRLWVVEMRDYPFLKQGQSPSGRIIVLDKPSTDDQQSIFSRRTVFASGLDMPTGIAISGAGIVCTHAGKLTYFEDTDGDLIADHREDWIEGFSQGNEQLRANHPTLGIDGWWYVASGLRGGDVRVVKPNTPPAEAVPAIEPLMMGTLDLRFKANSGALELITGASQFGLSFDSLGNRYACSNRNPAIQFVLEQSETFENAFAGIWPSFADRLPSGELSRVYPLVKAWTTSNLHAGQYTAACGLHVQCLKTNRPMESSAFVCEPTAGVVARSIISWDGQTGRLGYTGRTTSHETKRDWLASTDDWFRPVNVFATPGGVGVVDMHRAVIEHPHWVPKELQNRPDERDGNDRGRIYCFEQDGGKLRSRLRDLAEAPLNRRTPMELVALLRSTDSWTRSTVTRLLIERIAVDHDAFRRSQSALLAIAIDSDASFAARSIATRLLAQWGSPETSRELYDQLPAQPSLRAVMLRSLNPNNGWLPELTSSTGPPGSLWAETQATREETLLAIIRRSEFLRGDEQDAQSSGLTAEQRDAVLQHYDRHPADLASAELELHALGHLFRDAPLAILRTLVEAKSLRIELGHDMSRMTAAVKTLIKDAGPANAQTIALGEALARELLTRVTQENDSSLDDPRSAAECLFALECIDAISKLSNTLPTAAVESAIRLCELDVDEDIEKLAIQILARSQVDDAQAAIRGRLDRDGVIGAAAWQAWALQASADEFVSAAAVRLVAADRVLAETLGKLMLANSSRQRNVVELLLSGKLDSRLLGGQRVFQLVRSAKPPEKQQLQELLKSLQNPDRQAIVERYAKHLAETPSPENGKKVFAKHCAGCHRVAGTGVNIGPEISDTRTKQPRELLTAILNPSLAVDNRYFQTSILTADGRTLQGLLESETLDSLVIRTTAGEQEIVRRADIERKRISPKSLMPDGFENSISPSDMSDLISFLKNWRYLDGSVPAVLPARKP